MSTVTNISMGTKRSDRRLQWWEMPGPHGPIQIAVRWPGSQVFSPQSSSVRLLSGGASASILTASACLIEMLADVYHFRRYPEVFAFLQRHPNLIPLLIETAQVIPHYFGQGTPIALDIATDPEAEDDQQLVAWIQTDLEPIKAIARLTEFDTEWWLAASHASHDKLCIHVEYR